MALQPEIRTDSLEGQLPDSLPATEAALRESIFRLRDSLATIPPDTLPSAPPVTAEELFGAGSTLVIEPFPAQSARPIYESAPFQGIVLVLVFAYLVIIYHNLREVYVLCRKLSLDRSKPGRMTDTQGSTYARFLWAALAAALAGFTRSVGVLLAVYLGVEMVFSLVRRPEKRLARSFGYLGCLLAACLGTLAYLGVNAAVTGDPFTFLTYQKEHWSQSLSLFFNTAAYQTEYLLNSLAAGETRMVWGLYIPNLVCGFGALGIMVPAIKKLRPGDGAFFLAYYGVAMGCTWLLSAPRYLAVCYPLALGLGALAQGKANWLRWSLLGCMFLLQVGYTCLYILGFPVY